MENHITPDSILADTLLDSKGLSTTCYIDSLSGEVHEFDNFVSVVTHDMPDYHWGNYVVLKSPPRKGDAQKLCSLFDKHVQKGGQIRHYAFTWNSTNSGPGYLDDFIKCGFEIDESTVLELIHLAGPSDSLNVLEARPVTDEKTWQEIVRYKQSLCPEGMKQEAYDSFLQRLMLNYQKIALNGHGSWYSGWKGNTLVCDLGIFGSHGIGRLQSVFTSPKFRNQGACKAILNSSIKHSKEHFGFEQFIVETESNNFAAKIYESVGFIQTERLISALKS